MRFAIFLLMAAAPVLALDLTKAVVAVPAGLTGPEQKAVAMLIDEVAVRSQVRWPRATPGMAGGPAITIGHRQGPAEGFSIQASAGGVQIDGNDARGVLFGVGRLLRALHMNRGSVTLDDGFALTTAPKYPLRGHQLGYRPKTNSYDAWTVAMWEQYIRDLAVFGANAIELIPPRSDDDDDSPHFPLPPMKMMVEMSRICQEYGLDVWIWYPAMDKDYSDPATVEFALKEWAEVFRQLPRIDAVFVPGGDPGHTQPKYMMPLLEKQTASLHKYHPKAQMWMSPQSFDQKWLEEFFGIMDRQPAWLSGIVFGPQQRISLKELRDRIPAKYPIRHYPDITHSRQAQYLVPDWDAAYAVTEGREIINPRPTDQARIFELLQPLTVGFLTYSEGCNDDVNKAVWSGLGWDPKTPVIEILRQFARYYIADRLTEPFAQGLLALERNWRGPLATNSGVYTTLAQFQAMERSATPEVTGNWRFQQALYRAYYDGYVRARLLHEQAAEDRAMDRLRGVRAVGSAGTLPAIGEAEAILDRAVEMRPAADWRARCFELAEALFQSIRMQLSVERYQAIAMDRGATLDTIDYPLNSRAWLKDRFAEIRQLGSEAERVKALDAIVNWTNPGPGGFYDDLGNVAAQPHLVRGLGVKDDPAFLQSSYIDFQHRPGYRKSWWDAGAALNENPLRMHYSDLDPAALYRIRVVYVGDRRPVRLMAGGSEVHGLIEKPLPARPLEFDIPRAATRRGELDLSWHRETGLGGNGRGAQVAEVWLIRK
jgi:hypothetical protein